MALSKNAKVAFIGTGIMGAPIAEHLISAGYDVTVYNRTSEKAQKLVSLGAHAAESVADAAKDADVIFTMVGYPTDVEDVYLSTDGLIRVAKKGAYLIDLTTSSSQLARDIHDAAEIEGKHAFDCPVTGGQKGAQDGTLTLIVGATENDVEPVRAFLETFSALAEQGGLDVDQMLEVVASGMGSSRALKELAPKSLEGDFQPGFLAEHFRKDIALALAQSEDLEITLPGAETAFTLYDMLCQIGGARKGTQAISLLYADEATSTAAGLDWSLLESQEDEGEHECCCGHDHEDGDHECECHGHGHHHEHEGHEHGHDGHCCH